MNALEFVSQPVGVFKEISAERLGKLVEGSRVQSFEANAASVQTGSQGYIKGIQSEG